MSISPYANKWTDDEVDLLKAGMERYGRDWKKIAEEFVTTRKANACETKFYRMDCPKPSASIRRVTRHIWSHEEDEKFVGLVIQFGRDWRKILIHFENRTSNQCSSHWQFLLRDEGIFEKDVRDVLKRHFKPQASLVPPNYKGSWIELAKIIAKKIKADEEHEIVLEAGIVESKEEEIAVAEVPLEVTEKIPAAAALSKDASPIHESAHLSPVLNYDKWDIGSPLLDMIPEDFPELETPELPENI